VQERRDSMSAFPGVFQIEVDDRDCAPHGTTPAGLDLYFFAQDAGLDAGADLLNAERTRAGTDSSNNRTRQWSRVIIHSRGFVIGDRRWTIRG